MSLSSAPTFSPLLLSLSLFSIFLFLSSQKVLKARVAERERQIAHLNSALSSMRLRQADEIRDVEQALALQQQKLNEVEEAVKVTITRKEAELQNAHTQLKHARKMKAMILEEIEKAQSEFEQSELKLHTESQQLRAHLRHEVGQAHAELAKLKLQVAERKGTPADRLIDLAHVLPLS